MASIDKRSDGAWRARWREFPGGPQRTKHFSRRIDAERFLTRISAELLTGSYVDPSAGQVTVAVYAQEYLERRRWRDSTRDRVERHLRLHIVPTFGNRPLASIRRAHVEHWAAWLALSASTVTAVHATFAALLNSALDDGRIARNPAKGANLPGVDRERAEPLSPEQVRALVIAAPAKLHGAFVLAAGTGLRQGELAGVSTDRVNWLRRTLRVDQQAYTPRGRPPLLAPPKSARSYRTIALPQTVVEALARHVKEYPPSGTGLLFHHHRGEFYGRSILSAHMHDTAIAAGLPGATWHSFRHAHASMLLSSGVSPALVAERLGHDVRTLMATYAHVIRADDDRVRGLVDNLLAHPAEDQLRTTRGPGRGN